MIGNLTGQGKKRHMVFVTARVHPGESPASLVCQGLCACMFLSLYVRACMCVCACVRACVHAGAKKSFIYS